MSDARTQVEATALNYIEGYVTGDHERHARCYHPEATKRRYVIDEESGIDELIVLSPQMMVDYAATGLSKDPTSQYEVIIDSIDDDVASVRVYSTKWVDLLHIVKARGEWRILHATWTSRGAGTGGSS